MPDLLEVMTSGTYPMYDENGVQSGVMEVSGQTLTFIRDAAYAATHPLNADFFGTVSFVFDLTLQEKIDGVTTTTTTTTIEFPNSTNSIPVEIKPCPECANPKADSYKWATLDDADSYVRSGIVMATDLTTAYAGQTCTITDELGPGQTFNRARLHDQPTEAILQDNLPTPSATFVPVAGEVYELRVRAVASGPGPFQDTGRITCNGVVVFTDYESVTWHDGNAGGGSDGYVSVGDYTWWDTDKDGVQDSDELPVPNVTVNLYDNIGVLVKSTTTDENGFYSFTDLLPSTDYVIEFVKPADSTFTTEDSSTSNEANGSDADVVTGRVEITTPATGNNSATAPDDPTFDAGFVRNEVTPTPTETPTPTVTPTPTETPTPTVTPTPTASSPPTSPPPTTGPTSTATVTPSPSSTSTLTSTTVTTSTTHTATAVTTPRTTTPPGNKIDSGNASAAPVLWLMVLLGFGLLSGGVLVARMAMHSNRSH